MTHIANCMRADVDKSNVYITSETSSTKSPTVKESVTILERRPLQATTAKYQLWPSSSRSPVAVTRQLVLSDKSMALSMGRSPTSLSDTAASPESVPFWHRGGSLSRRRKVSVPELGSGSANTMTTVQEAQIDSPTIPGRPPLRKASIEAFGHERSSSAPGTSWRFGPFGDALVSCVTGPSYLQPEVAGLIEHQDSFKLEGPQSLGSGRPLSPILSPVAPSKPVLKVDTDPNILNTLEIPPEVPPKSPSLERRGSPTPRLNTKSSRTQLLTTSATTASAVSPNSAVDARRSPVPHSTPISSPPSALSPPSAIERRGSPKSSDVKQEGMSAHSRNISESSVLDRGRPVRRSSKRQRSRTCSEVNKNEAVVPDNWTLPKGMRATDASVHFNDVEKENLRKQAWDQAEKFEVLNKRDVASLSRELRALDERCEYLRKTYKSLRAGRQKLHSRMISYLKRGETVIFSRESLLKQEEALAELDISIDEFILKLEQAENRRLRLRQKLLEHVAAALVLNPSTPSRGELAESTPPRSPVKSESPARIERKDVESIKIYADGHVLNLFSDIEQAIGKMCEATC
ncbi:hypothetical protein K432DRAFT_423538 [Lepidopterella palustris CBS 459.81]|uniref:Up-regulated during septation protein 1 domain-containing protein n=1 Tax=Lepidopterella palustris CBS 459.81 TaxID=1314670 RepID=A0A8E2JI69_9PEZI|nr:hypothetical protein K432DRAFT_423538 [Lepidopterella palustris CBS 459.81]